MPSRDLYAVLGVGRKASDKEILRAYRKLTRKHHPEVNPGDEQAGEVYGELCLAYGVLGDRTRRAEYDRLGHDGFFRRHPEAPAGPRPQEEAAVSGRMREIPLGEILGLAPRTPAGSRPRPGEDIQYILELTFFESVKGQRTEIRFPRRATCPLCAGSGAAAGSPTEKCLACRGSGLTLAGHGPLDVRERCAACGGRGYAIPSLCSRCLGAGQVEKEETVRVEIPPGVVNGSEIRIKRLGHTGANNGPPGDLIVITRVEEHSNFERKGDNIYSRAAIMVWEAGLGAEVEVQTIDGPVRLAIPPGAQYGQLFRLPARGAPNLKTGKRGDHFVRVFFNIPVPESEAAREAYLRLAEAFGGSRIRTTPGD